MKGLMQPLGSEMPKACAATVAAVDVETPCGFQSNSISVHAHVVMFALWWSAYAATIKDFPGARIRDPLIVLMTEDKLQMKRGEEA